MNPRQFRSAAVIPAKTGIQSTQKSHSCESRNLIRRRRIRRLRFRAKRFRLSPEWRVLFIFANNTEFSGIRKYKNTPFRRKFILANAGAGISFSKRARFWGRIRLRAFAGGRPSSFAQFLCKTLSIKCRPSPDSAPFAHLSQD
ncbi:MAG: hypothetical protein ACR2QC_12500 [Gammaproteobacteria bacterium]